MSISDNPNELASHIVGQNLSIHQKWRAQHALADSLSAAGEDVARGLKACVISSGTAEALERAGVPLGNLYRQIQTEVLAGRWSSRDLSAPFNGGGRPSVDLQNAFAQVLASWHQAISQNQARAVQLRDQTVSEIEQYRETARRMLPGPGSILAPVAFPNESYIGSELQAEPFWAETNRARPRWIMQIDVACRRDWPLVPKIDFGQDSYAFVPSTSDLYRNACASARSIVADQLSRAAPAKLRVTWIDSLHQGQSAGVLADLFGSNDTIADKQIWEHPADIDTALVQVSRRMAEIEQKCLSRGFSNLAEYNAHAGQLSEAQHVVVLTGYPSGFNESSAATIQRITENGGRLGVSVIIVTATTMASTVKLGTCEVPVYRVLAAGDDVTGLPVWWQSSLLPSADYIFFEDETPYAPVHVSGRNSSIWVPCQLHLMSPERIRSIVREYVSVSAKLDFNGLGPRQLEEMRGDKSARTAALRSAMLSWLHGEESSGARPQDWTAFLKSGAAHLGGEPYSSKEAVVQASYLCRQGFVETQSTGYHLASFRAPRLTPKGVDAALKGELSLQDFIDSTGANVEGKTENYYGPIIHGNADGAQLAWGNQSVWQNRSNVEQVAPGYEELARVVANTLEQLPRVGLSVDDTEDAQASATEILTEVVKGEPDRGRIRRALAALRGFLAPVAGELVKGAGEGAHELAKTAIEQLQNVSF